jgi:hypothetical protein
MWKLYFSCGCVHPKNTCKRRWIQNSHHYVCPSHPDDGIMLHRISVCELCFEEFTVRQKGKIPKCCPECTTVKRYGKSDKVPIIPLTNPDILANQNRSDCKNRNNCLDKYKNNILVDFLPCLNCLDYIKEEIKPTQFANQGGDWLDDF